MIIQVESPTAENLETAKRNLQELASSWGQDIAEDPSNAADVSAVRDEDKVIDPVSITALIFSIPSTALAVADVVDRIRSRRRATELIDQAQQLAEQQVTVSVVSDGRPIELATLTPDQLLDLAPDETPTN